jgi:hypothetical protein
VTTQGGAVFVQILERIATFDDDGTLWCEQSVYFQVAFRLRPHQGDGAAASRMEDDTAVQATIDKDIITWNIAKLRRPFPDMTS